MFKNLIIGRLGKDPEQKTTNNGKSYSLISVAIDGDKKKDGTKEEPTWVSISIWEKLSDLVQQYLQKGSMVYVECSAKGRKKEDGKTEYLFTAKEIKFLSGIKQKPLDAAITAVNAQNAAQGTFGQSTHTSLALNQSNASVGHSGEFDDIPF